ncbi:MAG: cell wall anchor protein [Solirubrobacterales bacterium]|nr:cell wall anchor protein [Solirubrobacterales bacterium]
MSAGSLESASVHVPRRLQALIVAVSLAGASFGVPAAALAQNAGDEQYQDPLTGQTPPPSTGSGTTTTPTSTTTPDVSTVPQLSPSAGTGTTTPATPTTPPTQALPSTLPNTGVDGRIVAATGLGLLLCGIGLRLRTSRERF